MTQTPSYAAVAALLNPASVAILGASDDAARIGGRPLRWLREAGYKGRVYPINPNRPAVQGLPAFKSVADLPETPDVAIVALPASLTLDALEACAARGTRSAIVFSAGFAETGSEGAAIQAKISQLAAISGMRILGPNCLGAFNAATGFYGTFSQVLDTGLPVPGNVAIVTQSGAYGSHLAYLARERGLGVKYWMTTGNESDLDVADGLRWLVDQPDVTVIMAYAEGVKKRGVFIEALEIARRKRKAIVFMKLGRSEIGAQAVGSHTAALAGADAVYDAVFRQYGVWRARTTNEQLDVAYACSRGVYPTNNRLGIFTLSGGFGIQMADAAEAAGLDVAPMPDDAQAELLKLLPYATTRNPVDATAQALTDVHLITTNLQYMLGRGNYDAVAAIFGTVPSSRTFAEPLRQALEVGIKGFDGRLLVLTMIAPTATIRAYEEKGFLIYDENDRAIAALGALTWIGQQFARAESEPPAPVARQSIPKGALSEHQAKALLRAAGLPLPDERLATDPDTAAAAAEAIGFPVVLKIVSADIPHKTEIGGVLLDVRDEAAVREGTKLLLERGRAAKPGAAIDGVLVAPMLKGGVETIIGVNRDAAFGPVVMFGLGGIFVEVLKDVAFRLAPFDVAEAHRMIREIKGYKVLDGARGKPHADVDALARTLADLSAFAAAHADSIVSIDINPFLIMPRGQGGVALDALVQTDVA